MDALEIILRLEELYLSYGYLIVFLSSFIEISPMGWIIPGGGLLAVGGFFAFGSKVSLLGILVFGWTGAWLALLLAYYLGKQTGYLLIKRFNQQKNAERAKGLLEKQGGVILTTSMLSNLTRFMVAFIAGTQHYNFIRFLFYSATASLAWSSIFIIVGYFAGSEREKLETGLANLGILAWGLVILATLIIYIQAKKEFRQLKERGD